MVKREPLARLTKSNWKWDGEMARQHLKTGIPMAVGISEILTRAAVTYLLVYRVGFLGMTFASPACWFTSTLLCVICYKPMMHNAEKALEKTLQAQK